LIVCRKKGCDITEYEGVELHHIIPKYLGGNDKDGRVYLCKKHHDILQQIVPSILAKFVSENNKEKCKEIIKDFSLRWFEKDDTKATIKARI